VDASKYLASLIGQELKTPKGCPNSILRIEGADVIVATTKSPGGQPVPIKSVQASLDMLERDGEVVIDRKTVGYRSAFIGAVLASLPGTKRALAPARVFRAKTGG
jgi:hypothetical protein